MSAARFGPTRAQGASRSASAAKGLRLGRPTPRSVGVRATPRPTASRGAAICVFAARSDEPHLQLATAKLPGTVSAAEFNSNMYQWAATLTTSGQNMPFILPIKTDMIEDGFKISLCNLQDKGLVSVGDLVGTVEDVPGTGQVFFVRFYLGDAASADPAIAELGSDNEKLQLALKKLVDADTIMNTMQNAIKKCAIMAMTE